MYNLSLNLEMTLFRSFQKSIIRSGIVFRLSSASVHNKPYDGSSMSDVAGKSENEDDMPVEMKNPFILESPKCILCKYDIEPNYKNVRLLSQFISSYTGKVYGRHITGLCAYKQEKLEKEVKKARNSRLLSFSSKDPNFLSDPDLYDPSKPFRYL